MRWEAKQISAMRDRERIWWAAVELRQRLTDLGCLGCGPVVCAEETGTPVPVFVFVCHNQGSTSAQCSPPCLPCSTCSHGIFQASTIAHCLWHSEVSPHFPRLQTPQTVDALPRFGVASLLASPWAGSAMDHLTAFKSRGPRAVILEPSGWRSRVQLQDEPFPNSIIHPLGPPGSRDAGKWDD